jgi:hypothetical protein
MRLIAWGQKVRIGPQPINQPASATVTRDETITG